MEGEKVFGSKALDDADIAPTGSVGYNPPRNLFLHPVTTRPAEEQRR